MIEALELIAGILLIGAAVWAGNQIGAGIESALGEKPIRDRARD